MSRENTKLPLRLIISVLLLLVLAGGVWYLMYSEIPAPKRQIVEKIDPDTLKSSSRNP